MITEPFLFQKTNDLFYGPVMHTLLALQTDINDIYITRRPHIAQIIAPILSLVA